MSVHKDHRGKKWIFMTRIRLINGEIKQIKKGGFRTKAEAKEAEAKFLISKNKISSKATFREVTEHFLSEKKQSIKMSSYDRYESYINKQILPYFDRYPIAKITPKDISDWKNHLLAQNLKKRTCTLYFSILSSIFSHAVTYFDLPVNPCLIARNFKIKEEKKPISFFTLEEFNEFISIVDNQHDKLLYYTLFYTGMRSGELLALQWSDIENNVIHITKSVNLPSGKSIIGTPKSRSSIRDIMIPDFLLNLLIEYKQVMIETMAVFKDSFYIFGDYTPLTYKTLYNNFHNYLNNENISVKKISLHGFRHSHASYLINICNANPILVADRLGHTDKNQTLNIYSHLYPSGQSDLIEQMNKNSQNVTQMLLQAK